MGMGIDQPGQQQLILPIVDVCRVRVNRDVRLHPLDDSIPHQHIYR